MTHYGRSDLAWQREIGSRLKTARLNANLSQQELADATGLNRNTIVNAENGKSCTLATLIALLRGLRLLDQLDLLVPPQPLSPNEIHKLAGKRRQRATGKRGKADRIDEDPGPWNWGRK